MLAWRIAFIGPPPLQIEQLQHLGHLVRILQVPRDKLGHVHILNAIHLLDRIQTGNVANGQRGRSMQVL